MRIVTFAGPGKHRGLQYGQACAPEIASAATALKTHLAGAGHPPGPLGARLMGSPLVRAAAEYTPDLWDEVTALANGARVPIEDVLLLTFLDEVWALTRTTAAPGCSVIARTIGHTTEIGQTMDLPDWTVGRSMVLRTGSDRAPTALVMAYPGLIGLCGANEAGLGVAVNALSYLPLDEEGLGVAFITRHLLTLTTLAQAESFLTAVPHAAGQSYTVAASDGIATFEASAAGVHRVGSTDSTALIHTNHSLAAVDGVVARRPDESSRERLEVLRSCIEQGTSLADALTGDVVLDGRRWGDTNLTFAAFRAVGSESVVRFIDGAKLRGGRHEWSRFSYR
jgi:hypothetical protein